MPYIKWEERDEIVSLVAALAQAIQTPGQLAYALYLLLLARTRDSGFEKMSGVLGVFEAVKLEFYRRVVVPYEQEKIAENGDVG